MTTDPQPPPEATLITQRIETLIPQPSRSHLAREAGISPALWAKIEKGYDQSSGIRVPYRGSARAVAAMASVLGITPAQLRKAGRSDAAKHLTALPEREPELPAASYKELTLRLSRLESMLERALADREHRDKEDDTNDQPNGSRRAG